VKRIHARIVERQKTAATKPGAKYGMTVPNSTISFEMVPIPAGEFAMGAADSDPAAAKDEKPQRKVRVDAFWMQAHEVTWDEYRLFMFQTQTGRTPTKDALVDAVAGPTRPYVEMSFGMGINGFPAISMTQHAANKYAEWLSAKTGEFYRLPTEAEWEYAARAGTTSKFYWGETIAPKMAHCKGCGSSTDIAGPLPVGSFPPNAFGLFDMSGNIDQWVADCFHRNYQGAPVDGSAWKEPNCRSRVLRGGSWRSDPTYLHSAARASYDTDVRYLTNGLRVARSQ
jgi:formylglycine-generating enzyme required for sulfatase activity